MDEAYLRYQITQYLTEQGPGEIPTKLLCLVVGVIGYSFSDEMINDQSQFIPTDEEIKKYKSLFFE
jgi:hypothetical protein